MIVIPAFIIYHTSYFGYINVISEALTYHFCNILNNDCFDPNHFYSLREILSITLIMTCICMIVFILRGRD